MSSLHNNLSKIIYDSNIELIKKICNELNKSSKIDDLIQKFLEKPKKIKGGKAIKDPNAPKRAKSSYMFFTDYMRTKIRAKYPNDSMGEVSKKLGKMWNSLTPKEKSKFEKMASKDKVRYQNEKNNAQQQKESVSENSEVTSS